jgi:hypothetical protein
MKISNGLKKMFNGKAKPPEAFSPHFFATHFFVHLAFFRLENVPKTEKLRKFSNKIYVSANFEENIQKKISKIRTVSKFKKKKKKI